MLAKADALVTSLSGEEMVAQLGSDAFVLVDIRDPRKLERDRMIPGTFHAPCGMLDFWLDAESRYHKPRFAEGKIHVFYCASS